MNKYPDVTPLPQPVQPGPTVVVVTAPLPTYSRFDDEPLLCTCPFCRAQIQTRLTYKTGLLTWLLCVGACFIGLWLGCCLIPFYVDAAKDVEHYCPHCNNLVGVYKRIS